MTWQIRRRDVEFFRRDLWKDERSFPKPVRAGLFAKDCFSEDLAQLEARVLTHLGACGAERLVPKVYDVRGSVLSMESIQGIRLFDLIRHLRLIELERRDGLAHNALMTLITRCGERLRIIQRELYKISSALPQEPYPLEQKLEGLLDLFVRILDLSVANDWRPNLRRFVKVWQAEHTMLPFRDATPKNMMLNDRYLRISGGSETERRERILRLLLSRDADYWADVEIVDIDFSSVIHLTSPEDDPISLYCHEWTYGVRPANADSLLLMRDIASPDPKRCAASFVVRYLRFGGRKLAYRLINSQAAKVRFAYDNPVFYFLQLPEVCREVSEEFCQEYSPMLELISLIGETVRHPSPADQALLAVDHFRRFFPSGSYWQETPDENNGF